MLTTLYVDMTMLRGNIVYNTLYTVYLCIYLCIYYKYIRILAVSISFMFRTFNIRNSRILC